jgi:polysaccharide biosynthesis protein PslG
MVNLARWRTATCFAARAWASLALVASIGAATAASPAPGPVIPDGFGVSVHRVTDPREWQAMADAGFRIVRLDLTWEQIETAPGRYDWSYFDGVMAALRQHGMRPLLILDYGNPVYSKRVAIDGADAKAAPRAAAPASDREVDAFVNFAAQAVRHFRADNPIWEIWNEPEHAHMWPPKSDATQFLRLATRTCEAMRRVDPALTIYAPGAAKVPTDADPAPAFLRAVVASKLPACLSGLSAHPYAWVNALDDSASTWRRLRTLLAGAAGVRSGFEFASTESGVSTFKGQVSDTAQASYIARMMLLNAESNVRVSIWYDWRDDGDDGDNPEHRFGVLRRDLSRKPAWQAMQVMTSRLRGERFACRLSPSKAGLTALAFRSAERTHVAVWTAEKTIAAQRVSVGRSAAVRGAVDMLGQPVTFAVVDAATVELALGPQPVYLDLGAATAESLACAAGAAS